jgi:hypothetical protein
MDRTVDHRFAEVTAGIELEPDLAAMQEADLTALLLEFGLPAAEPVFTGGPLVIIEDLDRVDPEAMCLPTQACAPSIPKAETVLPVPGLAPAGPRSLVRA